MSQSICSVDRRYWMRDLQNVALDEVKAVIDSVIHNYAVSYIALPQAGLGMLKTKDAALHEPYFLGEFPISTCQVRLTDKQGNDYDGSAQIMQDNAILAALLAVCDAILAHNLSGVEKLSALVELGEFSFQQRTRTRKAMLGSTRVDFSLLGEAENNTDKEALHG